MIEALEYLLAQARSETQPPDLRVEAIAGAATCLRKHSPAGNHELLAELAAIVVHIKDNGFIGRTFRASPYPRSYAITPMAKIRACAMFLEWAHGYVTG